MAGWNGEADMSQVQYPPRVVGCKECGAAIVFVRTALAKVMPVNAETHDGEHFFNPEKHISHFSTCTKPEKFRKAKEPEHFEDFGATVHFGKHKGKTIDEILDCDPSWLNWAVVNNVITLSAKIEADVALALKKK